MDTKDTSNLSPTLPEGVSSESLPDKKNIKIWPFTLSVSCAILFSSMFNGYQGRQGNARSIDNVIELWQKERNFEREQRLYNVLDDISQRPNITERERAGFALTLISRYCVGDRFTSNVDLVSHFSFWQTKYVDTLSEDPLHAHFIDGLFQEVILPHDCSSKLPRRRTDEEVEVSNLAFRNASIGRSKNGPNMIATLRKHLEQMNAVDESEFYMWERSIFCAGRVDLLITLFGLSSDPQEREELCDQMDVSVEHIMDYSSHITRRGWLRIVENARVSSSDVSP